LERVGECAARRHVGLAEPRQVGSYETKPFRELRDEIAKHVAGSGKAVQQQDRRHVLRPSFAIEDADAAGIHFPIRDCAHGTSCSTCLRCRMLSIESGPDPWIANKKIAARYKRSTS